MSEEFSAADLTEADNKLRNIILNAIDAHSNEGGHTICALAILANAIGCLYPDLSRQGLSIDEIGNTIGLNMMVGNEQVKEALVAFRQIQKN